MHRSNPVHRLLVLVALLAAFGLVIAACGTSAPRSTTGAPATSETGSSASTTAGRAPEGTAVPPTDPSTVPSDVVTTGTSQPPSIRAVSQAQLTEPWGCGHGFAATNTTRTIALVLQPEAPPRVGSSTVTLPDPAWHGHLDLGRDLLSVACADLDVRRSPAADETWPVVHGTLRIDAPASASGCAPSPIPARVVATDLSVEAPDGTIITFPELTMTNDQWGCSAG